MQKISLKLSRPFQMIPLTLRSDFYRTGLKKEEEKVFRSKKRSLIRGGICVTLVAFDRLREPYGIQDQNKRGKCLVSLQLCFLHVFLLLLLRLPAPPCRPLKPRIPEETVCGDF